MNIKVKNILKRFVIVVITVILLFFIWQNFKQPPTQADWQEQLTVPSTAEFNGDEVKINNVRNFRYLPTEKDLIPAYYTKTYNLNEIKKIWYVTEPFNENKYAGHTFLSFEFNNGDFLAITMEARKTKDQVYSIWKGFLHTYPLIYIAADERDVLLLRANVRKDRVYVYPVKTSSPENSKLLLTDILNRMNTLVVNPIWYNTFFANCTSSIAHHINKITPGRVSKYSWQLLLTASADQLALKLGLLDTDLSIDQARQKYFVTDKSNQIGDVPEYSKLIREN